DRLAVSGAGRMHHAIGEAKADEAQSRARLSVQRMHPGGHEMGERGLLGHQPVGDAAVPSAPALASGDGKRPPRKLGQSADGRSGPRRGAERGPEERALRHGQATMAALAILKPKLVPGARLVKKDSDSFCLSPASSGLGLATVAVHPGGAEMSVTGTLSSNSKSMKNSGSATRSVRNRVAFAGVLSGRVTWNSTRWSGRSCIQ